MFNIKALGLLLAAVFFGVGAAFFANDWLQRQADAKVTEALIERRPVLVAARTVEFGRTLEQADVQVVKWPADLLPKGVLGDPRKAVGLVASQKLIAGEPLLSERLVERLTGSALSAMIAPNMRAITVRVNDVAGVAGFLLPGNRVDVFGTRKTNGSATTTTVLENVKVLAVDQSASREEDDPVVVRAVTLEAGVEDSITLVKATEEGTVQLALRNPEDLATSADTEPVEPIVRHRAAIPSRTQVRIIRGTSIDQLAVRN